MKLFKTIFSLQIMFFFVFGSMCFPAANEKLVKRIVKSQDYLVEIMDSPDTAIPQTLIDRCYGIIILRQYKAGFIFGAKGGAGIALVRDKTTNKWSAPAFIKTGEGSFGIQIGGQAVDSVFLIMNQDGMNMLNKTKFKVGVDASAAAGPVGRDAEAKVGPKTAILAYSSAKGLYAGATFEGGVLLSDKKANESFYGVEGVTLSGILFENAVPFPAEAQALVDALVHYAGPV